MCLVDVWRCQTQTTPGKERRDEEGVCGARYLVSGGSWWVHSGVDGAVTATLGEACSSRGKCRRDQTLSYGSTLTEERLSKTTGGNASHLTTCGFCLSVIRFLGYFFSGVQRPKTRSTQKQSVTDWEMNQRVFVFQAVNPTTTYCNNTLALEVHLAGACCSRYTHHCCCDKPHFTMYRVISPIKQNFRLVMPSIGISLCMHCGL